MVTVSDRIAGGVLLCPAQPGYVRARRSPSFYDRLAERRTVVAPGPWFGDSDHVMRIGLAYEAGGQLEKGLEVISDALRWCATASSARPENAAGGV